MAAVDVLLVEDNEDHVALFRAQLGAVAGADLHVHVARSLTEALAHLDTRAEDTDVVVLDLGLPDATGLTGLEALISHPAAPPVVVLTTLDNEHLAHAAVQRGAQDYLPKVGINGASILRSVRYARERWTTARKRESLVTQLQATVADHEEARRELNHRVRNLLSVVLSLANHTAWTTGPGESFLDLFGSRLRQLANVHEALARRRWQDLDVHSLLQSVLAPHLEVGQQVRLLGALDAVLKARVVRPLALSLHELYTNAVKYGALMSPQGRLEIEVITNAHDLTLVWCEQASDKCDHVASGSGQLGHHLVENLIQHELGGKMDLTMKPEGLRVRFDLRDALHSPLDQVQAPAP